jgi:hypothetical protein
LNDEEDLDFWGRRSPRQENFAEEDSEEDISSDEEMEDAEPEDEDEEDQMDIFGHR